MQTNMQFAMPPTQMMNILAANFRPSQKIKVNHPKKEFRKLIEEVENEIELFDDNTDSAITNFKLTDETKIRKLQKRCQIKMVMSALSSDFVSKYSDQLEDLSSTELIEFIKNRIGFESEKEISDAAQNQIRTATRQINENEKFTDFLDRLNSYSRKMKKLDSIIKTHLVEEAFRENLTPKIKRFLLEHDKNTEKIDEIAKYLDRMQKFKKDMTVNEIAVSSELTDLKNEIAELKNFLKDNSINTSRQINELRDDFYNQKLEKAELFKISTQPKREPVRNQQNTRNQTEAPVFQHNPNWEYNRFGKPYRCRHCGILGHKDESCKGTNLTCGKCQKIGHTFPACPENPRRTMPKN